MIDTITITKQTDTDIGLDVSCSECNADLTCDTRIKNDKVFIFVNPCKYCMENKGE
jgi:hypothetical protein